ncbi:BCL11 transcription factor chronophage isoform X4 [Haemaphysalis longicornis]
MSRRKQDKPQPRKRSVTDDDDAFVPKDALLKASPTLEDKKGDTFIRLFEDGDTKPLTVKEDTKFEPEHLLQQQDFLTCGVCQKEFALSDIVRFIQHKVHSCNKENCLLFDGAAANDDDFDADRPDLPVGSAAGGGANSRRCPASAQVGVGGPALKRSHHHGSSGASVTASSTTPHHHHRLAHNNNIGGAPGVVNNNNNNHSLDLADRLKARVSLEPHVHKYGGVFGAAASRTGAAGGLLVNDNNGGIVVPPSSPPEGHAVVSGVGPGAGVPLAKSPPASSVSPLRRPASTVDVGVNTTYTEPNSYTCFTCKHAFPSAWLLVQHCQNLHSLKIYVDANISATGVAGGPLFPLAAAIGRSSTPPLLLQQHRPTSQQTTPSACLPAVPAPTPPAAAAVGSSSTPPARPTPTSSTEPAPQVTSTAGVPPSLAGVVDPSTHPALQLLRLPLSERQFGGAAGIFGRSSSHDFRVGDLLADQLRPQVTPSPVTLASSTATPPAPAPSSSSSAAATPGAAGREGFRPSATQQGAPPFGIAPLEPQLDFYSQRLRQLAGATSPSGTPAASNAPSSPRKQLTPPAFSASATSTTGAPLTPTATSAPPSLARPSSECGTPSSRAASPKLKSCEYCGKSFRFQSNLIVHRRSHTGEKPYRCHICNHACTQASKLKRHMKTHRRSPGSGDNTSVESARSTPDGGTGPRTNGDDASEDGAGSCDEAEDEEEEEEMDEEEEEEEEEDEDEEDLDDEEGGAAGGDRAEDLTVRSGGAGSSVGPSERKSLLGEVMEKIGLTNIQQYSEAYRQALEESGSLRNAVKQERPGSAAPSSDTSMAENGSEMVGVGKGLPHSALDFGGSLLGAFDGGDAGKRLKLDLAGAAAGAERDVFPAGLWLPSMAHRDFYLGLHPQGAAELEQRAKELKLGGALSPRPGPSGAAAALALMGSHLGRPKDRRNDTCEYCGKVFKNCSNLTVHRRSHTGEKPYKCELCSYACAQSSKLTRHMKTHGRVGKDVYRCRFCDMPFSVPSTLEKHMRKCVVNQNAQSLDSDSKDMT